MTCYPASRAITTGVKNATMRGVGVAFATAIITMIAVGAASLLVHCFLVDFVLIDL